MRFADARHVLRTEWDVEKLRGIGIRLEEGWREKVSRRRVGGGGDRKRVRGPRFADLGVWDRPRPRHSSPRRTGCGSSSRTSSTACRT